MAKKSNGEKIDGKPIEEMSEKELFVKIMHLCSEDDITESELREILKSVEEVRAKRKRK